MASPIDKELEALRKLHAPSSGGTSLSPRELMEHYQRQVNADPDYEESKNPGSRRYPQLGVNEKGKSATRARDTELGRVQQTKENFPSLKKQRSTKKNPVPRGTVGEKTRMELDLISKLMGKGKGKKFSTQ